MLFLGYFSRWGVFEAKRVKNAADSNTTDSDIDNARHMKIYGKQCKKMSFGNK